MAGGDFGSGFPSNLPPAAADRLSVLVFSIFASVCSRYASGTFIYGIFRSRGPSGTLDGRLMMLEEAKALGGAPRGGGCATWCLPPSVTPFAWFQS